MNIPGFTAESSLASTDRSRCAKFLGLPSYEDRSVLPATFDEWTGCVDSCEGDFGDCLDQCRPTLSDGGDGGAGGSGGGWGGGGDDGSKCYDQCFNTRNGCDNDCGAKYSACLDRAYNAYSRAATALWLGAEAQLLRCATNP